MLPTLRQVVTDDSSTSTSSVTIGADSRAGDILVALIGRDWGSITGITAPSASGVTWTQRWLGNNTSTNTLHSKIYTGVVDVDGAKTITTTVSSGADAVLAVVVVDGSTVDPSWFDKVTGTQTLQASSTSHVIPALTMGSTEELYVGWAATNTGGNPVTSYSVGTSGLSKIAEAVSRTYITGAVFAAVFTGTGSTGTRTVIASRSGQYVTAALLIKGKPVATRPGAFLPFFGGV